jgi:hypothetical protein
VGWGVITTFDTNNVDDYRRFLAVKSLPQYRITGRGAWYPDEYERIVSGLSGVQSCKSPSEFHPSMFDYQRDITRLAIRKRKFAAFIECGYGKTMILLEFAKYAVEQLNGKHFLIISPLMVKRQTLAEAAKFYPDLQITDVPASKLQDWMHNGTGIGITNYDALDDDIEQGNCGGLGLDESSMLKSHYGKWGQKCLEIGRGLEWKLCLTGTPAPNDRIEYANHAVFLDHFPTVNSFLARFFVNRGQTDNRWELKAHALEPFYRALSHWCIFMTNPATYGWKDNAGTIPPISVTVDHVELTPEQEALVRKISGQLVVTSLGGITSRSVMGQIAKGNYRGEDIPTNKFNFIRGLIERDPNRSTLVWCHFNDEQTRCENAIPQAVSISGDTPLSDRLAMIDAFKTKVSPVLISKPRILGFGLNLQVATRQIFSGLQDSYEEYWQAIKRSNRVHSTEQLDVHIPVTEIERPMIETVLRKASMVEQDTREQERIFKQYAQDTLEF